MEIVKEMEDHYGTNIITIDTSLGDLALNACKFSLANFSDNQNEQVQCRLKILCNNGITTLDNIVLTKHPLWNNAKVLDINNVSARINPNGILSYDGVSANYFVPKDSNASSIYSAALWLSGLDDQDSIHVAADKFCQEVTMFGDWSCGPVANNYDQAYMERYYRLWKVSRVEVDNHRWSFTRENYEMPEDIRLWPGNGNISNGEAEQLAPYFDYNNNGIYDPENGDYPLIRGDQAVLFIINDAAQKHYETGGAAFGVEIVGMYYAFASEEDYLNNTVFLNYKISNRSNKDYHQVRAAAWCDFDLGYAYDDYIGCDRNLSMAYVYNGKEFDGPGAGAYSGVPPAQGVMLLNKEVSGFIYYNNQGESNNGEPYKTMDYYNYMNSKWKDGKPMCYGGDGYYPGSIGYQEGVFADFMFDGIPETGSGWTEASAGNAAGDRRGLIRTDINDLAAGQSICLDIAYPFAQASEGGSLVSLALLREKAAMVKSFYQQMDYDCLNPVSLSEVEQADILVNIYPNPSNGKVNIDCSNLPSNSVIRVYNTLGVQIMNKTLNSGNCSLELKNTPNGVYFYNIINAGGTLKSGKLIINR